MLKTRFAWSKPALEDEVAAFTVDMDGMAAATTGLDIVKVVGGVVVPRRKKERQLRGSENERLRNLQARL